MIDDLRRRGRWGGLRRRDDGGDGWLVGGQGFDGVDDGDATCADAWGTKASVGFKEALDFRGDRCARLEEGPSLTLNEPGAIVGGKVVGGDELGRDDFAEG